MKLRQVVWALVFLADRGEDEPRSCGAALAAVVVALGLVVMLALGRVVLAGWTR